MFLTTQLNMEVAYKYQVGVLEHYNIVSWQHFHSFIFILEKYYYSMEEFLESSKVDQTILKNLIYQNF